MAAFTAVTTSGLTLGDPFTTRLTVARETFASRATSSSVGAVGRILGPPLCIYQSVYFRGGVIGASLAVQLAGSARSRMIDA